LKKPKKVKRICRDKKCPRMKIHFTSEHRKPEPVPLRQGVVLDREDFTDYAAEDVGVWTALTEGMPKGTTRVEVNVVRRAE
jgi:hypothetical protein